MSETLNFIDELEDSIENLSKHDQMLGNVIQIGRVIDPKTTLTGPIPLEPIEGAYVLVQIGGEEEGTYTRNWMPWTTQRAGADAEWWMPDVDEQVVVVAPSGNLALGIIIGTLYRGNWFNFPKRRDFNVPPTPANHIPGPLELNSHKKKYSDGTSFTYNKTNHDMEVKIKSEAESPVAGLSLNAFAKGTNGGMVLQLGNASDSANLLEGVLDISAMNSIKLKVGENSCFEMSRDEIKLQIGQNSINMNSQEVTITAGSKLTINTSGADVS